MRRVPCCCRNAAIPSLRAAKRFVNICRLMRGTVKIVTVTDFENSDCH